MDLIAFYTALTKVPSDKEWPDVAALPPDAGVNLARELIPQVLKHLHEYALANAPPVYPHYREISTWNQREKDIFYRAISSLWHNGYMYPESYMDIPLKIRRVLDELVEKVVRDVASYGDNHRDMKQVYQLRDERDFGPDLKRRLADYRYNNNIRVLRDCHHAPFSSYLAGLDPRLHKFRSVDRDGRYTFDLLAFRASDMAELF